jgi:hypothetical protein
LLEGVFGAPRLMFCTSTAMDEGVVDEMLGAYDRALERVQPAIATLDRPA